MLTNGNPQGHAIIQTASDEEELDDFPFAPSLFGRVRCYSGV